MKDTVYLIGAGINQVIKYWNIDVSPPLNNTFFQVASKFDSFWGDQYSRQMQPLYDFIKKYWKKNKSQLASQPFDIEKCLTLIESKILDTEEKDEELKELMKVRFLLRSFITQVLLHFSTEASRSEALRKFGKKLLEQKPTIISFNYDTFVEDSITSASGMKEGEPTGFRERLFTGAKLTDSDIGHSFLNVNSRLIYGAATFDEVDLPFPGGSKPIDGKRFYAINKPYDWAVLKLHGSLNWFQYLPSYIFGNLEEHEPFKAKKVGTVLTSSADAGSGTFLPSRGGQFIDPIIVLPTLYKEKYFEDDVYERILGPLWLQAKEALSKCKKLIVIGYSFPPTDFAVEKLFFESFAENSLKELTIVNPDTSLVQKIKELSHFDKPVWVCRDLAEFVNGG